MSIVLYAAIALVAPLYPLALFSRLRDARAAGRRVGRHRAGRES